MTLPPEELERIRVDQERVNREQIALGGREQAERGSASKANGHAERPSDWRNLLAKRSGRNIGDERNVGLALTFAPELRDLVRYNEFSLRVEFGAVPPWGGAIGSPWTDDDDHALQVWLQERELEIRAPATIVACISFAAKENPIHPLREYLSNLQWDQTARLDSWLQRCLDADGPDQYLASVGRMFLVSAVARAFAPGCQVDHVLVLEAPQGAGKSETARILAVRPDWFCDDLPELGTKDSQIHLAGRWIVELAELSAIRRADVERVKAYITREVDSYRPPYARRTIQVPRQTVFIGTTNEALYLRDATGNRRFWPVKCGQIDLEALRAERDQLWAEAVDLYNAGTQWHPTREQTELAAAEQSERVLVTELEADVTEYLDRMVNAGFTELDTKRVLTEALHFDPDAPDFSERAIRMGHQVAAAMDRAGWQRVRRSGRPGNRRTIYRRTSPGLTKT